MELIVLACLIATPANCQEDRWRFSMEPTASQTCLMGAPPLIAQWSAAHPGWRVTRWKCGVAGASGHNI